ncbi:MAG: hypothetical protein ACKOF9_12880 [Burkholderiales bacterium]
MSSDDSKLVNLLVRMVVPLRREFGQHLDVQHFLHDLDYAQDVLQKARSSQDTRLREHADYVGKLRLGPRLGEASATPISAPKVISKPPASEAAARSAHGLSTAELTEAELRAHHEEVHLGPALTRYSSARATCAKAVTKEQFVFNYSFRPNQACNWLRKRMNASSVQCLRLIFDATIP